MQTDELNVDGRRIEYGFVQAAAASGVDLVMLHHRNGRGTSHPLIPYNPARAPLQLASDTCQNQQSRAAPQAAAPNPAAPTRRTSLTCECWPIKSVLRALNAV
jgi:hypothetical protein